MGKNYFKILALLGFVISITSCEVENHEIDAEGLKTKVTTEINGIKIDSTLEDGSIKVIDTIQIY